MEPEDLSLLTSPSGFPLKLVEPQLRDGQVITGFVVGEDGSSFAIRNGIVRFVSDEAYAASFGHQWHWYRSVQLDGDGAGDRTWKRFEEGTGWSRSDLAGSLVLEAGCGAGRFTKLLLEAGARVCSFDLSSADDACKETVGLRPGFVLAQADIYAAPFPEERFDKVFCFGVLQHTPDPRRAFLRLARHVALGGEIAVDVYRKAGRPNRWSSKYWVRPLTTRLPPATLRRIVEWYVPRWLPIDARLARVPRLGPYLVSVVPCWNYTGWLDDPEELRAWAVLDTFDALSARYDKPQTIESVEKWFDEAGFEAVYVRQGGNGIVAKGRRAE